MRGSLAKTGMFGWVAGEGALELGQKWHELEKNLATPPCPFGIIAGRLADTTIANPLVEGAGDFVVSVEETASRRGCRLFRSPGVALFPDGFG